MIDAHCHLEYLHDQLDAVIEEAKSKGMKAIFTSACDPKHFRHAMEMREKYMHFVFACIGFHPEILKDYSDDDITGFMDEIRRNKDKIAAVGEIGMDYNWNTAEEEQERSRRVFAWFIELAKELGLPMVVHSRNGQNNTNGRNDGIGDALKILAEHGAKRVMLHCFSGNEAQLRFALEHGWMISYATVLCRSFKHQRLAMETPIDRLLLETDSPWLDPESPPRVPGQPPHLTNRPWKIEKSAELIAQKKGVTKEIVLEKTAENAAKFFRIKV